MCCFDFPQFPLIKFFEQRRNYGLAEIYFNQTFKKLLLIQLRVRVEFSLLHKVNVSELDLLFNVAGPEASG